MSFREEQEKMNLWVAFLNLENTYGTQESLMKVFERSVSYNDPKKMYLHLVKIYERANKTDVRSTNNHFLPFFLSFFFFFSFSFSFNQDAPSHQTLPLP